MATDRTRALAVGLLAALLGAVRPAAAQQQSMADVLTFLVTNDAVQTGSFERDRAAAQATSDTISRALLASLATLPVTGSSGAFVYRLNPELGTVERSTDSFGPFFVERATTAGRGQTSIGLAFQEMRFTSLDGRNLRSGSLVTTANQFTDEAAPFDVDQLKLAIDASIATLYGNAGITDRLEVGFAVPAVSLRLDGSRVNTYRGRAFTQATASAHTFGLADIVLRAKYALVERRGSGVSAAVDVRLPTGRKEDLLGAGAASYRFSGVGSYERGAFSAHVNGGVGTGGLAREYTWGGALALAATSRLTLSGELLGSWIDVPGNIVRVSAPNPTLIGVDTVRLLPDPASALRTVTVVPGVKWNVSDTWIVLANVLLPVTTSGLTSPITPFVGLDYAFGR